MPNRIGINAADDDDDHLDAAEADAADEDLHRAVLCRSCLARPVRSRTLRGNFQSLQPEKRAISTLAYSGDNACTSPIKELDLGMLWPLKYIMKVFYANENYAKYGVPGMNYFMALVGTAFYIMMTCVTMLFVICASSRSLYKSWRTMHLGIPGWLQASIFLGIVCLGLKSICKEEALETNILPREEVKKAIDYLLLYLFALVILIGFLGLRFLRNYH